MANSLPKDVTDSLKAVGFPDDQLADFEATFTKAQARIKRSEQETKEPTLGAWVRVMYKKLKCWVRVNIQGVRICH